LITAFYFNELVLRIVLYYFDVTLNDALYSIALHDFDSTNAVNEILMAIKSIAAARTSTTPVQQTPVARIQPQVK